MTYCESVTPFRVHFVSQHGEKYPTVESSLSSSTNFIATHFFQHFRAAESVSNWKKTRFTARKQRTCSAW